MLGRRRHASPEESSESRLLVSLCPSTYEAQASRARGGGGKDQFLSWGHVWSDKIFNMTVKLSQNFNIDALTNLYKLKRVKISFNFEFSRVVYIQVLIQPHTPTRPVRLAPRRLP